MARKNTHNTKDLFKNLKGWEKKYLKNSIKYSKALKEK